MPANHSIKLLMMTWLGRVLTIVGLIYVSISTGDAHAQSYAIEKISRPNLSNRDPAINEAGQIAWVYYSTNRGDSAYSHIATYNTASDTIDDKSLLLSVSSTRLTFHSNNLTFVASYLNTKTHRLKRPEARVVDELNPDGQTKPNEPDIDISRSIAVAVDENDVESLKRTTAWIWNLTSKELTRIPTKRSDNIGPGLWGNIIAWQWEQDWPFGYEILYSTVGGTPVQLTTNKFYDMGPVVFDGKIAWFGWDGYDYEVFLHDIAKGETTQITSNRYDDTNVQFANNFIVWEGYAGVEADIYLWRNGEITKISDNLDDDINPRIWQNKVVWQGFDGDDFEIFFYDVDAGGAAIKLTSNNFDDTNPEISNDVVAWLGFHDNWDSEIYAADIAGITNPDNINIIRITDNDIDDMDVQTAGRKIVWVAEQQGGQLDIMLAEPR